MAFQSHRLRPFLLKVLPALTALAVLLISLILVSRVQTGDSDLNRRYVWVMVLTIFALLVLVAAILHSVISLGERFVPGPPAPCCQPAGLGISWSCPCHLC